jgi:hypothetical protein
MKSAATGVVVVMLLAGGSPGVQAADGGKACATAKARPDEASRVLAQYSVPSLTRKSAKKLARAVARQPGLVSAKPDADQKTFSVVFDPAKASSADILAALRKVDAGTALSKESPFKSEKGDSACAGCPSRNACSSEREGK